MLTAPVLPVSGVGVVTAMGLLCCEVGTVGTIATEFPATEFPNVGMTVWPAGGPPMAEPIPLSRTGAGDEAGAPPPPPPPPEPELPDEPESLVVAVEVDTATVNILLLLAVLFEVSVAAAAKRYAPLGSVKICGEPQA